MRGLKGLMGGALMGGIGGGIMGGMREGRDAIIPGALGGAIGGAMIGGALGRRGGLGTMARNASIKGVGRLASAKAKAGKIYMGPGAGGSLGAMRSLSNLLGKTEAMTNKWGGRILGATGIAAGSLIGTTMMSSNGTADRRRYGY